MALSLEQVYNADESAQFLHGKMWVPEKEKFDPGKKIPKEQVTFMLCSNPSGTHKLPLLVMEKSKSPRAFKKFNPPVCGIYSTCENLHENHWKTTKGTPYII